MPHKSLLLLHGPITTTLYLNPPKRESSERLKMARQTVTSSLLILIFLITATNALPDPRSRKSEGQDLSQRLNQPNSKELPVYIRLDDVLERPGDVDPSIKIISQGRILNADNDNDAGEESAGTVHSPGDHHPPHRLATVTEMLSTRLQLIRHTIRRWTNQYNHGPSCAEAAAQDRSFSSPPLRVPPVAEELRRRSSGQDRRADL